MSAAERQDGWFGARQRLRLPNVVRQNKPRRIPTSRVVQRRLRPALRDKTRDGPIANPWFGRRNNNRAPRWPRGISPPSGPRTKTRVRLVLTLRPLWFLA